MKSLFYLTTRGDKWVYKIISPTIEDSTYHVIPDVKIVGKRGSRAAANAFVLREIERRKEALRRKQEEEAARPHGPEPTIREYADTFFVWKQCRWIRAQHRAGLSFKRTTGRQRRGHLTKYIFPLFGGRRISELPAIELEEYLLSLPLKNATRKQIMYSYGIVTSDAKRHGIIQADPMADRRKWSNSDRRIKNRLTEADIARLFPQTLEKWRVRAITITEAVDDEDALDVPKKREIRGIIIPRRTTTTFSSSMMFLPCGHLGLNEQSSHASGKLHVPD